MKPMNMLLDFALITSLLLIVSCGEGGVAGSSPGDVVKTMAINLQEENYDAVVDLYINKNGQELTEEEKKKVKAFLPSAKEELDEKGGIKEVVITEETISEDGKTAIVRSRLIYGNGEKSKVEKTDLVRVNGGWQIEI
jgi:hypothetical protein